MNRALECFPRQCFTRYFNLFLVFACGLRFFRRFYFKGARLTDVFSIKAVPTQIKQNFQPSFFEYKVKPVQGKATDMTNLAK